MKEVSVLHDNTSLPTKEATATMELTVLPHPPYSPNLEPSDFHFLDPYKMHCEDDILQTMTS
jgi:hypothetical protein